ncbi:trigger factor [Chloroflexota bacterium]
MKVNKDKIENNQAYLTVEMESDEMEMSIEAAYGRLAKKANIPGFRKGKAPRSVLESYIGRENVLEEAFKQMVPQAYEKAIKEQDIVPFAQPDIEITQSDPVIFKAVVPLPPNIELGEYTSIKMTPELEEISEDNVNAVLEELRHQYATWDPVERPLDFSDMAVLNIDSEVEEKPFIKKLGAQYQVLHDSTSPVPGFAEQLIGMHKEEEREFKLKIPEDFAQSGLAGKEVFFKVKVSEIKEEKLPELDDELAQQVSPDFKTVEVLREEATANLKLRAEERSRIDFEEKVINEAIDCSKIEYPPVLVEMEIDRIINEQARQMQMGGRNLEGYLQSINKTEEELRESLRSVANKNIIGSMVLGKVSEAEKVEISDADIDDGIDKQLASMSTAFPDDKKDEMRKLLDSPQMRESIRQNLMTRKTIERLVELAKNTEAAKTESKEGK